MSETPSGPRILNVPIDVVGKHVHSGKRGTLEVIDGKVKVAEAFGLRLAYVTFSNDFACFIEVEHLQEVKL